MSARRTATFENESFDVAISSDGELIIVDNDIEYDLAFVAMGGEETTALRLLDAWREDPTSVVCHNLGLDDDTLRFLAADWAEHVLPIFERKHPKDKRPREAIEAARNFVAGKTTAAQLEGTNVAAWAAKSGASAESPWSAAAWSAAAAWAAAETKALTAAALAAKSACRAATDTAEEQAWQVRHFVHVMECIQAGWSWPKIEETP